jgi:hypothetical protein
MLLFIPITITLLLPGKIKGKQRKNWGKTMANYSKELAQDAAYQSHTGRLTGLWFLPKLVQELNTNNNNNNNNKEK